MRIATIDEEGILCINDGENVVDCPFFIDTNVSESHCYEDCAMFEVTGPKTIAKIRPGEALAGDNYVWLHCGDGKSVFELAAPDENTEEEGTGG
jgi:hypothetical protein